MPPFDLAGYRTLLTSASAAGYTLAPVDQIGRQRGPVVYLRHDVDLHLEGALLLADVEEELGARSCWMVPMTMHFNPWADGNRTILRELVRRGHAIGLHYQQPISEKDLTWQVLALAGASGFQVRAISLHKPGPDAVDEFREHPWYVHPHAERYADVVYVSDSARRWRDDSYLQALRDGRDVQLLTHHEHWIGTAGRVGRDYFVTFNAPAMSLPAQRFVEDSWTDIATHR